MSEDEAYEQAFDHLLEARDQPAGELNVEPRHMGDSWEPEYPQQAPVNAEDESVPFGRGWREGIVRYPRCDHTWRKGVVRYPSTTWRQGSIRYSG
jgi:hypothetical protein